MKLPLLNMKLNAKTKEIEEFLSQHPSLRNIPLSRTLSQPLISIVMPSFNQVKYIEKIILSVLNQDYPYIELIVIDGGSSDGTLDILKKYEKYLTYWYFGPDAGQSDALNHGFSKASGDIYGWMNSDDLYLPGAFKKISNKFLTDESASVVFGDFWSIDGNDKLIFENYSFDFNLFHFVYEGFHLNVQAMFWRKEVYDRFGNFDIQLHRTMDYDFIIRLGLIEGKKSFKRIAQPLACFRRHNEQKTRLYKEDEDLGYDPIVRKEHRIIANKCGFNNKYLWYGRVFRFYYRFRRAYWYAKRGGIIYLYNRILRR